MLTGNYFFWKKFAWICREENLYRRKRAEALRCGNIPSQKDYFAVAEFLKMILNKGVLSDLSKRESKILANSLQEITRRHVYIRRNELNENSPLYYLCARSLTQPYGSGSLKGYVGLGLRVADAILEINDPSYARSKIIEYLLK